MKSILFVFEVCSYFLLILLLQNVDGKLSLRAILKESDTLTKRMSKADETIRRLKEFAKLTDSSQTVDEEEIGKILKRNIDEEESSVLPFIEEVFDYIHLRSDDGGFKKLQNKIKRTMKMVKSKVKDVISSYDRSQAVVKKKFKFRENFKKPKRMIKKKKRTIETNILDKIFKAIDYVLIPTCKSSKSSEKDLRRISKRINKDKTPITKVVREIENIRDSTPQSIEQIIRDEENQKIDEMSYKFDSNSFLMRIKEKLQGFSDALYNFLAYLSSNDLFENVLPGVEGMLNIQTSLIEFLATKFCCLIDGFGLGEIGEPLKALILKLFNLNDFDEYDGGNEKDDDEEIDDEGDGDEEIEDDEEIGDDKETDDDKDEENKLNRRKSKKNLKNSALKKKKLIPLIQQKIKKKRGKKHH